MKSEASPELPIFALDEVFRKQTSIHGSTDDKQSAPAYRICGLLADRTIQGRTKAASPTIDAGVFSGA